MEKQLAFEKNDSRKEWKKESTPRNVPSPRPDPTGAPDKMPSKTFRALELAVRLSGFESWLV